jgi:hypothetical protein
VVDPAQTQGRKRPRWPGLGTVIAGVW